MTLEARVRELMRPGGALGRRWPRYEERAAQVELAGDIAATLERGGVLLAEAPTGIGKSLAYLLPSVLAALERDMRVVVATCTRSLQDQLIERDLPALLEALEVRVPFARLKGKQNYLCPRSLELVDGRGADEHDVLETVRRWAAEEAEGDLDRFAAGDPEAFRRVRGRIATDPNACTMATCGRGRECFWVRARRQAASARLLVVNHALLALSGEVDGLLPEFDLLIVDEAHRLEGVLLGQLERSVSRHRFEDVLRMVGTGRASARGAAPSDAAVTERAGRGGGLLARVKRYALPLFGSGRGGEAAGDLDALGKRVAEARADVERLFAILEPVHSRHEIYGARARYRSASELFGRDLEALEAVLSHCTAMARGLHRLAEPMGAAGAAPMSEELAAELEEVSGRFTGLAHDLAFLAEASDRGWVYWRTAAAAAPGRAGGGRGVELHGAPVTVGEHARRLVLERARAAVLTSATLTSAGDFSFLAERLGLGEERGVPFEAASYPSPFPLARQMRVFVYDGGGDEAESVASVVAALHDACGRNQLVLLTAHERLRRARERLLARLPADAALLAQDWDGAAAVVSERFRSARGAILLGVQSLWEGVDFPGESLEILVVAKLPFSVPDDPLVEARGERLRERGLEPFQHDAVPEAVLRFRQGVGRLIRRSDDRGVLVVCDPRLLAASYRRPFLESLPVAPVRHADARELAREAAAFLARSPEAPARPAGVGGVT
jgi:Rad3-related DNA helicase